MKLRVALLAAALLAVAAPARASDDAGRIAPAYDSGSARHGCYGAASSALILSGCETSASADPLTGVLRAAAKRWAPEPGIPVPYEQASANSSLSVRHVFDKAAAFIRYEVRLEIVEAGARSDGDVASSRFGISASDPACDARPIAFCRRSDSEQLVGPGGPDLVSGEIRTVVLDVVVNDLDREQGWIDLTSSLSAASGSYVVAEPAVAYGGEAHAHVAVSVSCKYFIEETALAC